MPPQIYVASANATYDNPSGTMTFPVPSPQNLRAGDFLYLVMALENAGVAVTSIDGDAVVDSGWLETAAAIVGGTRRFFVYCREVTGEEGADIVVVLNTLAVLGAGVILAYRNTQGVAYEGTVNVVAASVNFVCPSRTLTAYSDMFLGVTWARLGSVMTPPAGANERIENTATDGTLAVFDVLPEVVGATGTKTAVGGTARNGFAASIAIHATGLRGVGKVFAISPPGAIGLPTEGV